MIEILFRQKMLFLIVKKLLTLQNLIVWCSKPSCQLGMAIPRRIPFLEESRSWGKAKLHSSGIEEYDIYSSGSSGNFRGMSYPKNPENPQKIQKNLEKKFKKKIQPWIYISKFRILGNNTKNWLVIQKNKNKNWKILTNFWKFSPFFHI